MRAVVGHDGPPSAVHAVEVASRLIPEAEVTVVHVWHPPFVSAESRQRLESKAPTLDELMALIQQDGRAEAQRVGATGPPWPALPGGTPSDWLSAA